MSLALRSNRLKTSSASRTSGVDLVADAQVGERRRLRALRVVLDQRARSEVAQLELAEPRPESAHGHAERGDRLDGAGNVVAGAVRIGAGEAGARQAKSASSSSQGIDAASGCSTRCRGAGSARLASVSPASPTNTSSEPSLQLPERERALQAGNDLGAQAELAALGAHQRRSTGVDAGSRSGLAATVAVVPRASLLWKP